MKIRKKGIKTSHSVEKPKKSGHFDKNGFQWQNRAETCKTRFKKCFYLRKKIYRSRKFQIRPIFTDFRDFSDI